MASFDTFDDDEDMKIQSTANDALTSKYSSCSLGYFQDPFIKPLVDQNFPSTSGRAGRKPPIINRGYYGRVQSIQTIIDAFLDATRDCDRQIVSLGCGFDTNSVRIISQNLPKLSIYEVDFSTILSRKVDMFLKQPAICEVLLTDEGEISSDVPTITSPRPVRRKETYATQYGYKLGSLHLISVDIREEGALCTALLGSGANPTAPTLVITECVLVYLEQDKVLSLTQSIAQCFNESAWVSYDMINPHDMFGKTMLRNLTAARHKVPGFTQFPTLDAHKERYLSTGWNDVRSVTMLRAFNLFVSAEEKHRIARLEMLDEIEEWELIMQHYAFTVAVRGSFLMRLLTTVVC